MSCLADSVDGLSRRTGDGRLSVTSTTGTSTCSTKMIQERIFKVWVFTEMLIGLLMVSWLVEFYVPSTARSFRDSYPFFLSLTKDVKLGKYTVPIGNRTPGRRVAVHYATAAPRQLNRFTYTEAICEFIILL